MTSGPSPRRSCRRSDDSSSPNNGLSKDETAFGVLCQHVLEADFKPIPDPDNAMKKIWIRNGKERKDSVDGVDWIKEDGFTVKNYEKFWRTEMAELENVIVNWAHKLPAEAKAHLDKHLFKDDDAAVKVAKVSPGSVKDKRKGANSKATGKKKRQKAKSDDDVGDGLPDELLALRKEWFHLLERGQDKVGVEKVKKTHSIKEMKEQVDSTKNLFLHNVAGCPKVACYKTGALDPLAKRMIAQVDAYVANQAETLRNEFLADLVLTNYKFTEEDKLIVTDEDKINDED